MRCLFRPLVRAASLLGALALALTAASGDADAGDRQGRAARARSGSVHTEVTRTGPGGNAHTWQKDSSWQRGGGRGERATTWTGPRGATATRRDTIERTDSGRTRNTTFTDRQGRTATRAAVVTRDPEAGTRSVDVERVGREGQTAHRSTVTKKTDDDYIRHSEVTKPDGSVVTREKEVRVDR